MRSIDVRVEPTVRLVTGATEVELHIGLHSLFGAELLSAGMVERAFISAAGN